MSSRNKSFTIVELLVVIAVMGLLSSIVLVSLDLPKQRLKAKIAKSLSFSQSVQNALGSEALGIWNFDEGSGPTAKDSSGYGNDGAINGASYSDDTPHKIIGAGAGKWALSFDGVNDYVDAGNDASTNFTTEDFSIELWIKTTYGTGQTLVQRGSSQVRGYTLMADPYVHLLTHQAGAYTYVRSNHPANTGEWQHWVAVREGTHARLYLNGVEDKPYTGGNPDAIVDPVSVPADSLLVGYGSWTYANGCFRYKHIALKII